VDPAANKLVLSSPVGQQISTVAMVQHSLASGSSSSHQPASAVTVVKEPSGSSVTILQAGHSSHQLASAVTVVKEPSGSSVAVLQAGHSAPASSSVAAANSQPSWCQALLEQFADVVNPSQQLPELPDSTDVLHHIKTSGLPISSKFRRLDSEKLSATKAEFAKLERDGIIRRSDRPWSSPLHMVRKAYGSWILDGSILSLSRIPTRYPI
jgi:hypothetical protein